MSTEANQGVIGDTAKLMMHRLIARQIRRDPTLVERAKIAHARQADQFAGWPFVREWDELLSLPTCELTSMLISRDRESPFYLAEGVDFKDYGFRIRLDAQREGWWNGVSTLIRLAKTVSYREECGTFRSWEQAAIALRRTAPAPQHSNLMQAKVDTRGKQHDRSSC
jgi:hypothetical protein